MGFWEQPRILPQEAASAWRRQSGRDPGFQGYLAMFRVLGFGALSPKPFLGFTGVLKFRVSGFRVWGSHTPNPPVVRGLVCVVRILMGDFEDRPKYCNLVGL